MFIGRWMYSSNQSPAELHQKKPGALMKKIPLTDGDIIKDLNEVRLMIVAKDAYYHKELIGAFINSCIEKYGEKDTKYYFDYWFDKYLNYE